MDMTDPRSWTWSAPRRMMHPAHFRQSRQLAVQHPLICLAETTKTRQNASTTFFQQNREHQSHISGDHLGSQPQTPKHFGRRWQSCLITPVLPPIPGTLFLRFGHLENGSTDTTTHIHSCVNCVTSSCILCLNNILWKKVQKESQNMSAEYIHYIFMRDSRFKLVCQAWFVVYESVFWIFSPLIRVHAKDTYFTHTFCSSLLLLLRIFFWAYFTSLRKRGQIVEPGSDRSQSSRHH